MLREPWSELVSTWWLHLGLTPPDPWVPLFLVNGRINRDKMCRRCKYANSRAAMHAWLHALSLSLSHCHTQTHTHTHWPPPLHLVSWQSGQRGRAEIREMKRRGCSLMVFETPILDLLGAFCPVTLKVTLFFVFCFFYKFLDLHLSNCSPAEAVVYN